MEVITKSIRRDDKKDLHLLAVPLVNTPISDLNAAGFDLISGALDVGDQNGRAVVFCISSVDGESYLNAVAFEDDCRDGYIASFNFG